MKFHDIVIDTLTKDTEAGAEWDRVTKGDSGRYWYEYRRGNAFTKIVPGLFGHRFLMSFLNGSELHTLWIGRWRCRRLMRLIHRRVAEGQARRLEAIYR